MELKMEMRQKMVMSARMQQCTAVLMMDNAELGEYIAEQTMENPILDLSEKQEWLKNVAPIVQLNRIDTSEEDEVENRIAAKEDARKDLYFQLTSYNMSSVVKKIAEYIIESLDENGYFTEDLQDTAKILHAEPEDVAEALKIVRQLEPRGVGAANLQECLLLQLHDRYPDEKIAESVILSCLCELSEKKYKKIEKQLNVSAEEVKRAAELVRQLNPRPVTSLRADCERSCYLHADLALVEFADHYEIVMNRTYIPELRFNNSYIDLLKTEVDEKTKSYIREKYEKARWLRDCVAKREDTILSVAGEVFKRQEEFLSRGPIAVKPLQMKEVSEVMKVHPSTVSRAIKGKYIQTKWGIYPMKYFFCSGIETEKGSMSAAQIRVIIRKIIRTEDQKHPLSDSKIAKILGEHGIDISRRTVASYREQMGISGSSGRKIEKGEQ